VLDLGVVMRPRDDLERLQRVVPPAIFSRVIMPAVKN
jgi:hypothetical protein